MNTYHLGTNNSIICKSTSITRQSPTQTELTNQGLQQNGGDTTTRTYEVPEHLLQNFITTQLANGGTQNMTLVTISAQTTGAGNLYDVTVTTSTLTYSPSQPYYEQAENYIHKKNESYTYPHFSILKN